MVKQICRLPKVLVCFHDFFDPDTRRPPGGGDDDEDDGGGDDVDEVAVSLSDVPSDSSATI